MTEFIEDPMYRELVAEQGNVLAVAAEQNKYWKEFTLKVKDSFPYLTESTSGVLE